jgi:cellulose synthase/poly-beta-1,6-N-acetylglucosamine synthase-like glycosyltransferase
LISVVVPLQHFSPLAEKVLARAIRAKTDVQLIIVTDNDAAQQLLEQKYGAACVVNIHPLRGRGYAICAGIKRAKHEMVLVLHGDTVLPDNWAEAVASTLRKGYVGGGFSLSSAISHLAFFLPHPPAKVLYGGQEDTKTRSLNVDFVLFFVSFEPLWLLFTAT